MIDCIICGKNPPFADGICRNCLAERTKASISGTVRIEICPKCASVKTRGKWHPSGYDFSKDTEIRSLVTVDGKAKAFLRSLDMDISRNDGTGTAKIDLVLNGETIKEETPTFLYTVKKNSCETCNRLTGSYYEAVIQIRSITRRNSEVLAEATKTCMGQFDHSSGKPTSFISKVESRKEGYDIYLGSNKDGQKLSRLMKSVYPCSITESKTLSGRGDGEDLYRHTYLIRIIDLERGSTIRKGDDLFVVKRITGDVISVRRPKSDRIVEIPVNDFLQNYEIASATPNRKRYQIVSRMNGETQLMSLDDFSTITISEDIEGESVDIVVADGNYVPV